MSDNEDKNGDKTLYEKLDSYKEFDDAKLSLIIEENEGRLSQLYGEAGEKRNKKRTIIRLQTRLDDLIKYKEKYEKEYEEIKVEEVVPEEEIVPEKPILTDEDVKGIKVDTEEKIREE